MAFQATPINILALLLVTLGLSAMYLLAKRRFDTNLPLLFYVALAVFVNFTGRQIDSYVFGGGVATALVLRFEFMNGIFTTIVLSLEMSALAFVSAKLVAEAFGLPF